MIKNNINIFIVIAILTFLFSCRNSETISEDEKEWLGKHPNLVVGLSPNAPPYQFINENGEIGGIFIDFLTIIEKEINYKFKRTYNSDFSKLLESTKTGTIDILLEVQETEERKTFLKFTPSLVSHNHIIVVRNSVNDIENINDLEGRKIAVGNEYAIQEYLTKEYPTYTLEPLIDDVECLQAVSTGQADAFVCQQAVATYYIDKNGISGLKIVGEVNYRNELAIASRKSLDTLNTILIKAVNSISNKERQQIYSKWLSFTVQPFYHETKFLVTIFSIFIIIIFLAISFNRLLQKKVKQKTNELQKSKEKAKESELKIRELKRQSDLILDVAGEGILGLDLEGSTTFINPTAAKMIGWEIDEILGKNHHQEVHHTKADGTPYPNDICPIYSAFKDGKSHRGDNEVFWKKDGSSFSVEYISTPIRDENNIIIGAVVTFKDISERKEVEHKLLSAKEKAEESDRLKSAFLANMSHEIRTPMNGILGFSELLKKPNLSGERKQKYIRIIEKSGKRMLNIINDIISISKIESGLTEVNMTETNINEQIEYIYTFFKPEAEAKGITLSFENLLTSKEAIVKTDNEKFIAILTNLVKNAIKYSEKGSIEIGYILKSERLQFYVKDTGIGIEKDRREAIFERFIQADISDKEAYQGAGLGLSISKAYVEMLGGRLWVESEKGKGSTFYFTLPYDVETKGENAGIIDKTDMEFETPSKKLKILIVDDDEISSFLLEDMTENLSESVLSAKNGMEAVEISRNNPDIDLILMDIQMPVMDGYETTRQIRMFNKEVIIIAQTAFALEGDREKAIEAGCNDYLSKPIGKNKLLSLLKKYFDNLTI